MNKSMENIEISIVRSPHSTNCDVYIYNLPAGRNGDVGSYYTFTDKGVSESLLVQTNPGQAYDMKPAFTVHERFLRGLTQAFLDYAKNEGVKNRNESMVEGELKAQTRHLEDLRTLLKL